MEDSCMICYSTDSITAWNSFFCDDITYEDVFFYCTQLERETGNKHVHQLCIICKDELRNTYNFIEKAKSSWVRKHSECEIEKNEYVLENVCVESLDDEIGDYVVVIETDEELEQNNPNNLNETNDHIASILSINQSREEEPFCETLDDNVDHTTIIKIESANDRKYSEKQLGLTDKPTTPVLCDKCPRTFRNKLALGIHRNTHQRGKLRERKYACQYCELKFIRNSDRHSHERTHDCKRCVCEYCGKKLSNRITKARHVRLMHKPETLLCDGCPQTFTSKEALAKHRKIHQQNRERKYSCQYCDLKFFTSSTCRSHESTHDVNREKKYKCDQCEKAFFQMGALNVHKRLHTGQLVECVVCKKSYPRLVDLKIHMRSHTNDRPFECNSCDKKFMSKSTLSEHVKKEHLGFIYKCQICSKRFKDRELLNQHAAEHNTFPFLCTICNDSFAKRFFLHRHLKRAHGVFK